MASAAALRSLADWVVLELMKTLSGERTLVAVRKKEYSPGLRCAALGERSGKLG